MQATCQSVDEQTVNPGEHLIIDGSTDDRILKWLSGSPQPSYRRWIHERDAGISDAFNKGVKNAQAEITHLLNSGDRYAREDSVDIVLQKFSEDPALQWVHSRYIQHRGGIDVISGESFDPSMLWKGMRTVAHPGMFIKLDLYKRYGYYDTELKIAMDYDFLIRIRNEPFVFIPEALVYFAPGGASQQQFFQGLKEVRLSHRRHIGNSFRQLAWQGRQRLLYYFMQTSIGRKWFERKNRGKRV